MKLTTEIEATTTGGTVWELFHPDYPHADGTGEKRWKPLSYTWDNKLELWLGGYSPVTFAQDMPIGEQCKADPGNCRGDWRDTVKAFAEGKRAR